MKLLNSNGYLQLCFHQGHTLVVEKLQGEVARVLLLPVVFS